MISDVNSLNRSYRPPYWYFCRSVFTGANSADSAMALACGMTVSNTWGYRFRSSRICFRVRLCKDELDWYFETMMPYGSTGSQMFSAKALTGRNQDAIKKTAAGMLKLLQPDLRIEDAKPETIEPVVAFAVEMRKRVVDQLAAMKPEEFGGVRYEYSPV